MTRRPTTPFGLFRVECGPGWAKLYQPLLEVCRLTHVTVLQVKEKFGGLRFYVGSAPDWVHDLIQTTEAASYQVCEDCGRRQGWLGREDEEPACVTTEGRGWVRTLCQWCRAKREETPKEST